MDITWLLFILVLFAAGVWTKRQNTKHIRKLRAEYENKWRKPVELDPNIDYGELTKDGYYEGR